MYRTHEMRIVRTEESGREEWACPTCGRRMLLRWPPHYEKQVVEPGDERACHVGSSAEDTPQHLPGPDTAAGAGDDPETADDAADETAEEAAAGQRCPNGRRWLRETGTESASEPVRPRMNPPEPV